MQGLLSTPFHRVYFVGNADQGLNADDIERLPEDRFKFPISLRVNYKPNDALAIRSFARYYTDNWGVRGISLEAEFAYDFSETWTVMPFARVYSQSGSRYYAGFAQHVGTEDFYTSDFDLAEFSTYKLGLGFRYAPIFGLGRASLFRHFYLARGQPPGGVLPP